MNIRFLLFLFCTAIALNITGTASAKHADEYIERLSQHPQVMQILEQGVKFQELSIGEMGLPDPVIMLGVDNLPVDSPAFDRFLPTSKTFGINQKIPSYSKRKAKSHKYKRLSTRQRLLADYTTKRLVAIFNSMLVNLDKVQNQEFYAKKQLEYYASLEDFLKGKLESGSGVYSRFSEVDIKRSLIESQLNDLKAERTIIEAQLISLVDEVPDVAMPNIRHVVWDENTDNVYPVLLAKVDMTIADTEQESADAAFYPNYGFNAVYKQREEGNSFDGDDWFSVRATVSVPLWYNWNQKPKLRAAEAGQRSAKNAYENISRVWTQKLIALSSKSEAALDNVLVFIEKDKALSAMIAAEERNYEAGGTGLDTVLTAQINKFAIKSQLAEQRAKHMRLMAELSSHIIGDME